MNTKATSIVVKSSSNPPADFYEKEEMPGIFGVFLSA